MFLDHHGHASPVRKFGLFTQPKTVMYSECIDGHCQRLCVDLREFFPARIILEELFEHFLRDLFRTGSVNFENFFRVRIIRVQSAKLTFGVSEENKKMRTITCINLFYNPEPCLLIYHSREDDMLNCVEYYRTVGFSTWFSIVPQPATSRPVSIRGPTGSRRGNIRCSVVEISASTLS